jgi:hypothetical protein
MTCRKYIRCVNALIRFNVKPEGDREYMERKAIEKASLETSTRQYEMEH